MAWLQAVCRVWVAALVLWVSTPALADDPPRQRDPETYHHIGETQGLRVEDAAPRRRPLIAPPADRPAWLGRALKEIQAEYSAKLPGWPDVDDGVDQVVVFRRNGRPTHLATTWFRDGGQLWSRFLDLREIVRVTGNRATLRPMVGVDDLLDSSGAEIVEPTGMDISGRGIPLLFVEYSSGGSSYRGYELVVYRLEGQRVRGSVRGGPIRPIIAGDPLGRGEHALIASDDRWGGYFDTCGQCGPLVPVVFQWQGDGYAPACRRFAPYYKQRMAFYDPRPGNKDDPRTVEEDAPYHLETWASKALFMAQMGETAEALQVFDRAFAEATRVIEGLGMDKDLQKHTRVVVMGHKTGRKFLDNVKRDFRTALVEAHSHKDAPCPLLMANNGGGHYGTMTRIESFR